MARFGIEEEFLLVDRETLVPLASAPGSRERLAREVSDRRIGGQIYPEFLTSQVECVTDPLLSRADAVTQLDGLRRMLTAHAAANDAVVAASGTPFHTTRQAMISSSPHYDRVATQLGSIARGHEVNGLHVHVEVADAEERVRALNRLRGWLPVLLALTGNSPFTEGADTGFASWRSILIRRLPATWTPPYFRDLDDYVRQVERLLALGAIPERSSLSWAARVSDRFPTVEARVCDAQLDIDDTVFAATLIRAIAVNGDLPAASAPVEEIDAVLWVSARYGMRAIVVDPTTGEHTDAWTAAQRLVDLVRPGLEELGDAEFVIDHLARLRVEGTGAERQRRAYAREGMDGLRRLHLAGAASVPASTPPSAAAAAE
ncbi:YbdK family carboxylate-amine ligase [Microbacterium sp. NPDC008134]|uniref:carboxylate-amine ligase n=1 Tax=Microbacterium sp. NPDC008134 TaxID=3364183 RepID=UPI0036EE8F96